MRVFPNNTFRCLIVYKVISEKLIDKSIEIQIHNNEKIQLFLDINIRFIKFYKEPYDLTVIEITKEDFDILDNVFFLDFDVDYSKGYEQYINSDVFALGFPLGDSNNVVYGSGKINAMKTYFEFEHNIATNIGFSGSPVVSLKSFNIIGVHKCGEYAEYLNVGIFIGFVVEDLKGQPYILQLEEERNYIIGKIDIKEKILKIHLIGMKKIIMRKK